MIYEMCVYYIYIYSVCENIFTQLGFRLELKISTDDANCVLKDNELKSMAELPRLPIPEAAKKPTTAEEERVP